MDPATISLIFAGVRLAAQAISGFARERERLDDFGAFLAALHVEGRQPTPEEIGQWLQEAIQVDDGLQAAIDRLKAAAAAQESGDPE